jgi:transcriptional regulator with PAS, ATPase and Fis domain
MSPGFLSALSRHAWPGNVRELQNVIERSIVLANGQERLGVDDLPPELQTLSVSDDLPKGSFHAAVKGFKGELVRSALAMHNGNKLKAAKELGISRCYLHRLLNQLNVAGGAEEEAELQEEAGDLALIQPDPDEETPIPRPRVARLAARIA